MEKDSAASECEHSRFAIHRDNVVTLSGVEVAFVDSVRKLRSLGWSYEKIKEESKNDLVEAGASSVLVERMLGLIDEESKRD